jgi:hypothetical protein
MPFQPLRLSRLSRPSRPGYDSPPGGDLASTGLMKELQRVQVQVPGKTVWNDSTANTEMAMAA